MKPPSDHFWPPLIRSAQVPWFIRARDWSLTLLAWMALAFSLRLGALFLWDYFSHPVFELTHMSAAHWDAAWERLTPFLFMILAVVIWIVAWGVGRRAQLRQTFDRRIVPPLPLEEHAASLGLDPREIEEWRQCRIVTVEFDGNRIAAARSTGREVIQEEANTT
jgi:poly-beta-1,6-N-acetyl-D-glucosamine biosynthesis protein PgaD